MIFSIIHFIIRSTCSVSVIQKVNVLQLIIQLSINPQLNKNWKNERKWIMSLLTNYASCRAKIISSRNERSWSLRSCCGILAKSFVLCSYALIWLNINAADLITISTRANVHIRKRVNKTRSPTHFFELQVVTLVVLEAYFYSLVLRKRESSRHLKQKNNNRINPHNEINIHTFL